jgi:hypothetical protein
MPHALLTRPATAAFTAVGLVLAGALRLSVFAQVPPATRRPGTLTATEWRFEHSPIGATRAVVLVPSERAPGDRFGLLVAFHGWGESARGASEGAWGWARDYELGASDAELRRASLRREAFLGHVDPRRFRRLAADLSRRPYRGVVVVCPYTPDVLPSPSLARAYGAWVSDVLVARARRELPVLQERTATGVDGVSLGGLLALETGFAHPEVWGVVGALQPAVQQRVERVLSRYRRSASRPSQRVRLVASQGDWLTRHIGALHRALDERRIAHEYRVVDGPHDYIFNRGAGGVEMLLFHDRALRGESAE